MKTLKYVFTTVLSAVTLFASCSPIAVPEKLKEADFVIVSPKGEKVAGFNFPSQPLVTLLGAPEITIAYENKDDPAGTKLRYTWNQLVVEVFQDTKEINSMLILGGKLHTSRGLVIGDTAQKVREKYGAAHFDTSEKIGYSLPTEDSVWGISFYLKNNKVDKINIVREP